MAELARRADIYQSVITQIMNGTRRIGPEIARKLAKAMDVGQVEMFIRAGMLDVPLGGGEDEVTRAIIAEFERMDTDTQEDALAIVRALRQAAERRAAENRAGANSARRRTT